jgi:hypothetical protein
MKSCLVAVASIGTFGSTPWKIPEYVAASRCIVTERLNYSLPVPLKERLNYIVADTPQEYVDACELFLTDSDLANRTRQANWDYYQQYVKPDALLWRCLNTALDAAPS